MEKSIIQLPEGTNEVTILHGQARKTSEPQPLLILGAITAPYCFANKNREKLNNNDCNIQFNREEMCIIITRNQHESIDDQIKGELKKTDRLKKWGINKGKIYTPQELANFIKMNIADFSERPIAMRLVDELMNIKAKVMRDIEAKDDNKGNKRVLIDQELKSNVPETFKILIPIFKGMEKTTINVEIYIDADFECQLISADLEAQIVEIADSIIDQELARLEDTLPAVPQIEI